MKNVYLLTLLTILMCFSCSDEETKIETGTFTVEFDNFAGDDDVALTVDGDTDYPFSNELGQTFNITLLGYYISEIKLEGPNGELFEDEMMTSADAVKGYYHILEGNHGSQMVMLEGVPAGMYNKITFTLGVEEEGVTEGATGGVLDVANGAWFWNWNNGYIAFAMEGQSPESPGEAGASTLLETNPFGMAYHVGGWSDPNNNREITLEFGQHIEVTNGASPYAHIALDVLELFTGNTDIDFSTDNSIHSPVDSEVLADNLENAFSIHHIEADQSGDHDGHD